MAPFLPFVHTPEQLEGKRAEPGQVGSEFAFPLMCACLQWPCERPRPACCTWF
jgi:hypothetical protein